MKNLVVILLIILPWMTTAQTLKTSVFSSGGGAAQSAGYNHFGTFGQPLSVGAVGTSYQTREGFIFAQQNEVTTSISSDQALCPNTEIETLISANANAEGELAYQWQQLAGSIWQDIPNAINATFKPNPLTQTTQFRMLVNDKSGIGTVASNPVTITIYTAQDYFAIPNPWLAANTHSSANGTSVYAPCNNDGTFLLTSTGQSTTTTDVHHFVYQTLINTSQATIIAHLADVQNGGYAGVMMRGGLTHNAPAIYFKTMLYNPNVLIGYRTIAGKTMRNLSQVFQLVRWMKIQKNGNNYKVFVSYNGTNWQQCYSGTINMGSTVYAGIFTESVRSNRTSMAWLDNVQIYSSLKTEELISEITTDDSNDHGFQVNVYPNPANDVLNIAIVQPAASIQSGIEEPSGKTKLNLMTAEGKMVQATSFAGNSTQLNISGLQPGVYILKIRSQRQVVVKKVIIQ